MTGGGPGEPRAGRWLPAACALLFLGAALAVCGFSPAGPRAGRPSGQARPPSSRPPLESDAAARARARIARARSLHGADSTQAADAMDAFTRLAAASGDAGLTDEALGPARESVRIRERSCAGGCPELAASLEAYFTLLWRREEYARALPLAERALAIRRRTSGSGSADVARCLYLLAEDHRALGDYALSEALHRRAIAVWKGTPGHDLDIANSLHYLGLLRWIVGDLRGAKALIERALALRREAHEGDPDRVAAETNTLGGLAESMKDPARALALYDEAQALWEATPGRVHPQVARSLASKARLLAASGDAGAAGRLLQRALGIRREAFGPDHYLVARSLADLGRLALQERDYDEAARRLGRALEIQRRDSRTPGAEKAATLVDEARLALATGAPSRAVRLALQAEAGAREAFLRTSRGLRELDALRYETVLRRGLGVALTALDAEGSGAPDRSGTAARIWDEMIRSRAMVLDELARRRRREGNGTPPPGLAEVARVIPPDASLVGFEKYKQAGEGRQGDGFAYAALILPGTGARPEPVFLGPAEPIEAAISAWRKEAGTDPRLVPGRLGEKRYREAGRRLRRLLWDPVARRLGNPRLVFIVPDGAVSLVSLAALPGDDGGYLIEKGPRIQYLSAERDLVPSGPSGPRGSGVLVLGDPDFDEEAARSPQATGASDASGEADGDAAEEPVSREPGCRAFRALRFEPLPGTLGEVEDVASLWSGAEEVSSLTGARATKRAFEKLAPGRRILHLATHGYFLEDRCPSSLAAGSQPEAEVAVGDDPLLLSGLALAGANRREDASASEDGILTSEEIARMDLSGTEWVVLSACGTGLGQVMDGEGVLGLGRAFRIAGVSTLILTLWPVDDGAARIWVHRLYRGRLQGLSSVEAVHRASLGMLESQRRSGGSTHPYFWGAFIAAGDWR